MATPILEVNPVETEAPKPLKLSGRYMTPDQMEFPCSLDKVDLPELHIQTNGDFKDGEHIIIYLEELGRMEGNVTSHTENGFVLNVDLSKPRLVKINDLLKALQDRKDDDKGSNLRRHSRYEPSQQSSHLTLSDGRTYPCEVVDISISGAAIKVEVIPSLGTYVMLGKMRGRVIRILEDGIAIEFVRVLDSSTLDRSLS